jgi:hypothetical protein
VLHCARIIVNCWYLCIGGPCGSCGCGYERKRVRSLVRSRAGVRRVLVPSYPLLLLQRLARPSWEVCVARERGFYWLAFTFTVRYFKSTRDFGSTPHLLISLCNCPRSLTLRTPGLSKYCANKIDRHMRLGIITIPDSDPLKTDVGSKPLLAEVSATAIEEIEESAVQQLVEYVGLNSIRGP